MKIVSAQQMRDIDAVLGTEKGLPTELLMENAGRAVAEEVVRLIGDPAGRQFVVLVGPGNNGGDGLVAARYLFGWGADVTCYLCAKRPDGDVNLGRVREIVYAADDPGLEQLHELLGSADCVVDAVFGTGSNRPLEGGIAQALHAVMKAKQQRHGLALVALDLPSGMNADTGAVDPSALRADFTITLGYPKLGLFNAPGSAAAGKLSIVDIGIPPELGQHIETELITPAWVRSVLPARPVDAHKGSFGKVVVCGGSPNYLGAPVLNCLGAARVGAGLVSLAVAKSLQPMLAAKLTETTWLPLPETTAGVLAPKAVEVLDQQLMNYTALLVGSGMGQSPSVAEFLSSLFFETKTPPMVIDADGLGALAKIPGWWDKLPDQVILTPHAAEMSRLTGLTVARIQSDRLETAKKAAREWRKTVVLKGAYTVVAAPEGGATISPVACAGLASAGTGDVLAGVIAGLLAQGMSLFDAAAAGVYIHGKAGEAVAEEYGDMGMLASDLLPALPKVIKQIRAET